MASTNSLTSSAEPQCVACATCRVLSCNCSCREEELFLDDDDDKDDLHTQTVSSLLCGLLLSLTWLSFQRLASQLLSQQPTQQLLAAFAIASIVDGHMRGQTVLMGSESAQLSIHHFRRAAQGSAWRAALVRAAAGLQGPAAEALDLPVHRQAVGGLPPGQNQRRARWCCAVLLFHNSFICVDQTLQVFQRRW